MLNKTSITFVTGLIVLALVGSAFADEPGGAIQLKLAAEKEVVTVNANGQPETQRVPAAKVVPEDKVIYTITYENAGNKGAENVFITNPIPEHMLYLDGTASGDNTVITFSIDNGKSFDLATNLTVTMPDGSTRKATAKDFTHIRWTLQETIAPEQTGAVSFWAQLE